MNKDLTTGEPSKILWRFCLPLFGSVIFQQLYNIADSLIAGKFIGENALAAVGNSYEITLIFIAFAFGCNIGCSVVVSKFFGAKNYNDMKTTVYTTFISVAILCLTLMVAGLATSKLLLSLINTPKDIIYDSAIYLKIYILGLPFLFFYNISTGIFTALGDSKTPFIFLAASSTSNIIVDILFVKRFDMGVAGVAWATFLCQSVSCILSVVLVLKRVAGIHATQKVSLFSIPIFKSIVKIAVPSILQQSFISIGNIVIQKIINDFGTSVIAGYSASIKLNNLVITSLTTVGNGITNYTSQNLGANKPERINSGFNSGIKMVWLIIVPFVLLYCSIGKYLLMFFMKDASSSALLSGQQFLWIVTPFYFIVSVKLIADGVLRGAVKMKQFMTSTFTDLILRVGLAFAFSSIWGSVGIWCAWPVGWSVATVISVVFYKKTVK